MSGPRVLVVDDSEAVLAYARAALSGAYTVETASDGVEALERLAQAVPAVVLLDLSMPRMGGDEVVARMRADRRWREVPIIIISSEADRARKLIGLGETSYLPKPLDPVSLAPRLEAVLAQAERRRAASGLAVLAFQIGDTRAALPLDGVLLVTHQPATKRVVSRGLTSDLFELQGRLVLVVDLARALRVAHQRSAVDRAMIVVRHEDLLVGLSADRVEDPVEVAAEALVRRDQLVGKDPLLLHRTVLALVREPTGALAVLDPAALLNNRLTHRLRSTLAGVSA
ncbi:MAG: response regulator [Archangium sp.]|nr:response regulator [Archangium sp.]